MSFTLTADPADKKSAFFADDHFRFTLPDGGMLSFPVAVWAMIVACS